MSGCFIQWNPVIGALSAPHQILGVKLGHSSRELLKEIEKGFGRHLVATWMNQGAAFSTSWITNSGEPAISLLQGYTPTEELIVHEFGHLLLFLHNYALLDLADGPAFYLIQQVWDFVEHHVYYPRLRSLGFMPDKLRVQEITKLLTSDAIPSFPSQFQASAFFGALMEINDQSLITKMSSYFETHGMGKAKDSAENAFKIVRDRNSWSSDDALECMLRCVNVLLQGTGNVSIKRKYTESRGSFIVHRAEFAVKANPSSL